MTLATFPVTNQYGSVIPVTTQVRGLTKTFTPQRVAEIEFNPFNVT